jgi:hypothetical protein
VAVPGRSWPAGAVAAAQCQLLTLGIFGKADVYRNRVWIQVLIEKLIVTCDAELTPMGCIAP